MILKHTIFKSKKLLTVFTTSTIICIVTSTYAFSQPNLPNNELILGIRTISVPVKQFCEAFKTTLEDQVKPKKIKIKTVKILNQYKGEFYYRYKGLLSDIRTDIGDNIDIECGPNSALSAQLTKPNSDKRFSENIKFIIFFESSSIKLLLKKADAERLKNSSVEEFLNEIKKFKIGVFEGTTTLKQFENNKDFYNVVKIESTRKNNALERALSALDNNGNLDNSLKIDALASDYLILYSLLEYGVAESGNEGEFAYIKERKKRHYIDQDYVIFPSEEFPSPRINNKSLPYLNHENYAIAIKKGTPYEDWLSQTINNVINISQTPETKLNQARKKLENPISSDDPKSEPEPEPDIDIKIPFSNGQTIDKNQPSDEDPPSNQDKSWTSIIIALVTALVTAFTSIIVAALNPELVREIRSWFIKPPPPPPPTPSKTIVGRVIDSRTSAWIDGANVSLEANATPQVEFTDSEGIFEFSLESSINKIRLRITADGYKTYNRRIDISNRGKLEDIRLSRKNEHNL